MNEKNIIKSAGGVVVRRTEKGFSVALLYKNDHWVLPKGRIEEGESERKAALREIYEEIGIPLDKMKILTKLGTQNYITRQPVDGYLPRPKTVTIFLVETSYKKIRPLKTDRFQKASWIDLNQALKRISFPTNKGMILRAMKYLKERNHIY